MNKEQVSEAMTPDANPPASGRADNAGARRGLILLAMLTLAWGVSFPIMKIALSEIRPWTFRTCTLMFGGFGLLAISKARGLKLAIPKGEIKALFLVGLLNITGWQLCVAYGLSLMNAGRAVIIGYTMPLWATIMGRILLKEQLTPARLVGLALGLTGLAVLLRPDIGALEAAPLGVIFMLGAAMFWGVGTVCLKYYRWTMPVILVAAWQMLLGGIPVVVGAFILEPVAAVTNISPRAALALLFVIVLPMWFCHWAFFSIVQLFPASVAALSTLAIPIVGVFSSIFFLGEQVGFNEIAALVLVVAALGSVLIGPDEIRRLIARLKK